MQKYQNYSRILSSGAPAPGATVTVYNAGTLVLATIYSDNISTPKANPFTADSNAYLFFYAADGRYDVTISGTGIVTPYTWGDQLLSNQAALPLTTKGDLLGFSTLPVRIPGVADGYVLTYDAAQATAVKWAAQPTSGWTDSGTIVSPTSPTDAITLASGNTLSAPGIGANSEHLGAGSSANGAGGTVVGNTASCANVNGVSIGETAVCAAAGQPGKVVIGGGASSNHASHVIGGGASDTADGQFVVGGNNIITDVFIGTGPGGNLSGSTFDTTYHGQDVSTADSNSLGSIILAGGRGRGIGTSSHVKSQTSFPTSSGSNFGTLIDRHIINAIPKALVHATATKILSINLPTGCYAGGRLVVTVNATAGGDFQTLTFTFTFAAINKTGTFTTDVDIASSSNACSNGTLTATAAIDTSVANTASITILATSAGIGVPTTLEAIWQGEFNSRQVTTIV